MRGCRPPGVLRVEDVPGALLGFLPGRRLLPQTVRRPAWIERPRPRPRPPPFASVLTKRGCWNTWTPGRWSTTPRGPPLRRLGAAREERPNDFFEAKKREKSEAACEDTTRDSPGRFVSLVFWGSSRTARCLLRCITPESLHNGVFWGRGGGSF